MNKEIKTINKTIEEFFPKKLKKEWLEKNFGKAKDYDLFSLNKSFAEPIWDFLSRGGKRWRAIFMLLCCEAVGGNPKKAAEFAIIPELLHNASLILDDIEDNSELRRGKPCLHKIYGLDIATNIGSGLSHLPYLIVKNSNLNEKTKVKAYDLIAEEMVKIHFGQALDIYWHKSRKIPKEKGYMQMAALKSGTLPRLAAKLGALIGRGKEKQIGALGKFAESLGVAFQIKDDVLGVSAQIGKGFGEDIKEGKKSLPILYAIKSASERDKKRLLEIINLHTNKETLVKEAISIIEKYKSISYSKGIAEKIVKRAWKRTSNMLPESEAKKKLKRLADALISR